MCRIRSSSDAGECDGPFKEMAIPGIKHPSIIDATQHRALEDTNLIRQSWERKGCQQVSQVPIYLTTINRRQFVRFT